MSLVKPLTRRDVIRINEAKSYDCPGYVPELDPNDYPEDEYSPAALADEWMSRLDSEAGGLVRQLRSENPGKRVKIAILDTGIDTRNVAFARHVSKGLIKVEDFVDPGGSGLDMNGHGTHSAALLCKIAPEAEIYVAKVVASGKHPPSPSLVAKAIYRASSPGIGLDGIPNWDVDIITMSLGYYMWHKGLDTAMRHAYLHHKIVLAAAANNGTMDSIMFPANLPTVICINAADGAGKPSAGNPPTMPGKDFSILGEAVESAWCCGPMGAVTDEQATRTKRKSGTSVATPIAAGVVALILELAYQGPEEDRQPDGLFDPGFFDRLRTYNGVCALLRDMADRDRMGECLNIKPWNLLKGRYNREQVAHYMKYLLHRDER